MGGSVKVRNHRNSVVGRFAFLVFLLVGIAATAPTGMRMRNLSLAARESAKQDYGQIVRVSGADEVGVDPVSKEVLIEVDPRYFRPTEVEVLVGDATKARSRLGWCPRVSFQELVTEMMQSDLKLARSDVRG